MKYRGDRVAFGAPGIPPRWTRGNKDGVGTAYSGDSRLWFTIWRGIITEVYFPRVDQPQLRDMQYLISDGRTFFHEERRHLTPRIERLNEHSLGYRIVSTPPNRSYELTKEVIAAPHLACLLQRTRIRRLDGHREPLDLYILAAPHLGVGGWANNAYVVEITGRELLAAERDGLWMVVGANVPFRQLSVGYVGKSDGWNDLAENYRMDYAFDRAPNGNVALTGQLPVDDSPEFTLGLGFGRGFPQAASALLQALGRPFEVHKERFLEQWERPTRNIRSLHSHTGDLGNLYHTSYSVTLAHEDKTFPGAFIASMSIPWGNAHGDEDRGGYHLVWTRDLCRVSTGLLAAGDAETPLRVLIYLAGSQEPDGGDPQNFWITGEPYWSGIQLDEVSFPILLAYQLKEARALQEFDPYDMILGAAHYLIENGPVTQQERWEELSGYSPSTLAANIAALIAAATFARERGDANTARFMEEYADFLESHIEGWTVTTEGSLIPEIPRHYIRIHPVSVTDTHPDEDANHGTVVLPELAPERTARVPCEGGRGRGIPGTGPLRRPSGRRSHHRGFAPRGGCGPQSQHAQGTLLAPVQTMMATVSPTRGARSRARDGAAPGPCSPESEASTSSRPEGTPVRTSARSSDSRAPPASSPNRSGMGQTFRASTFSSVGPRGRPRRSSGPTPST